MSLIVDVYEVPWKILALVKARILANREREAKYGFDWSAKTMREEMRLQPIQPVKRKKMESAFVGSTGVKWLLMPRAAWNQQLQGYECETEGLLETAFKTTQAAFEYAAGMLKVKQVQVGAYKTIQSSGQYLADKQPDRISGQLLRNCTFEGFIEYPGIAPTASSYQLEGYWYWVYDASVTETRANGVIETYQLYNVVLTSTDARPLAPSAGGIDLDFTDNLGTRTQTTILREEKIYTVEPSTQYPQASSGVEILARFDAGAGSLLDMAGALLITASADPTNPTSVNLKTFASTPGDLGAEVLTPLGFQGRKKVHFAIVNEAAENSTKCRMYVDGVKVSDTVGVPFAPTALYSLLITISASAADEQGIEIVDASMLSVSGIRLTTEAVLYHGDSFNPPSSIVSNV